MARRSNRSDLYFARRASRAAVSQLGGIGGAPAPPPAVVPLVGCTAEGFEDEAGDSTGADPPAASAEYDESRLPSPATAEPGGARPVEDHEEDGPAAAAASEEGRGCVRFSGETDMDEAEEADPPPPAPFILRSPLESDTPGGRNGLWAPLPLPLPLPPRPTPAGPVLRGEPRLEARGDRGDCDASESESSGEPTGIKGKSGEASRVAGREPGRLVCFEEAPSADLMSSSSARPPPPPPPSPRLRSCSSSSSSSSSSSTALRPPSRLSPSCLPESRALRASPSAPEGTLAAAA